MTTATFASSRWASGGQAVEGIRDQPLERIRGALDGGCRGGAAVGMAAREAAAAAKGHRSVS